MKPVVGLEAIIQATREFCERTDSADSKMLLERLKSFVRVNDGCIDDKRLLEWVRESM